MTPDDRKKFLEIVIGFAELKGKQLSAAALELYWGAMQEWSIVEFQRAAHHLLRTCEFMPTPGDFDKLRKAASGSNAEESWGELLANHGQTSDSIAQRALRALGGWNVVGFVDTDRLPYLKKQFSDAYATLSESSDASQALPQITNERLNITHLVQRMKA